MVNVMLNYLWLFLCWTVDWSFLYWTIYGHSYAEQFYRRFYAYL